MTVEADEDEHSIEMQLPYIAKVIASPFLCIIMEYAIWICFFVARALFDLLNDEHS